MDLLVLPDNGNKDDSDNLSDFSDISNLSNVSNLTNASSNNSFYGFGQRGKMKRETRTYVNDYDDDIAPNPSGSEHEIEAEAQKKLMNDLTS